MGLAEILKLLFDKQHVALDDGAQYWFPETLFDEVKHFEEDIMEAEKEYFMRDGNIYFVYRGSDVQYLAYKILEGSWDDAGDFNPNY